MLAFNYNIFRNKKWDSMEKVLRERLKAEKRILDILGAKKMEGKDMKVASYVAKQLTNVKTGAIRVERVVNLNTAFNDALNNVKILGSDVVIAAKSFSTIKFMPIDPTSLAYACNISFDVSDETMEVDQSSGKIDHFKIPQYLDASSADIFLAHEFIHALKETNYQEYILINSLSDVIPMFYELVQISNDTERKKDFLNIRMSLLILEKNNYNMATANITRSKNDAELYKVLQGRSGQYLNSFYYSLVLFNIYKSDPSLVLSAIKKVLNHEMTTLDMLINLGIYQENFDKVFNEEVGNIRKSLK